MPPADVDLAEIELHGLEACHVHTRHGCTPSATANTPCVSPRLCDYLTLPLRHRGSRLEPQPQATCMGPARNVAQPDTTFMGTARNVAQPDTTCMGTARNVAQAHMTFMGMAIHVSQAHITFMMNR